VALFEDSPAPSPTPALGEGKGEDALPGDAAGTDLWAELLQAGAAMLQGLAAQRRPGGVSPIRIERDPESGQPSLRLPLPEPALLQQLAKALAPWLKV
jgi:hypothetical protein